jgi:hypothetical protein
LSDGVASGVLRAAVVIVAFALVVGLTIGLVTKKNAMEAAEKHANYVLDNSDIGPASTSEDYARRSVVLSHEAEHLRDAAGGVLAGLAGDPDALLELANRVDDEAERQAENGAYLASKDG